MSIAKLYSRERPLYALKATEINKIVKKFYPNYTEGFARHPCIQNRLVPGGGAINSQHYKQIISN